MVNPIPLLASTSPVPRNGGVAVDCSMIQLLKELAGPLKGLGETPAADFEAVLATLLGRPFLQGRSLNELLTAAGLEGKNTLEDMVSDDEKGEDGSPAVGEVLLALLSAAACELQPWLLQVPAGQAASSDEANDGPSGDPQERNGRAVSTPATSTPATARRQLGLSVLGQWLADHLAQRGEGGRWLELLPQWIADTQDAAQSGEDAVRLREMENGKAPLLEARNVVAAIARPERDPQGASIGGQVARVELAKAAALDVSSAPPVEETAEMALHSPGTPFGGGDRSVEGRSAKDSPGERNPVRIVDAFGEQIAHGAENTRGKEPASRGNLPQRDWVSWPNGLIDGERRAMASADQMVQRASQDGFPASVLSDSVAQQIANRASLLVARGRTGLSIQLEPKELGKVQVHVTEGANGFHIKLVAENTGAREIIQVSLPQLKEILENQGLRVDTFDVSLGFDFSSFGSARDNDHRQGASATQLPGYYFSGGDADAQVEDSPPVRAQASLVDYRV